MLLLAIALAVLVGVALGLLGGGGSILTLPILRYVLGVEAHAAIALSLLVVGTTSLAAVIPYARRGQVQWRTAILFGAAGMTGAYFAGRVAQFIPAGVLLLLFGAMMFATAGAMLRGRSAPTASPHPTSLPIIKVIAEGLAVGGVTGLVGAGGGFLVVPALVLFGGLSMDVAIGTSLLVIALKSFAGFAGFWGHTAIDWNLGIAMSLSAVVGSVGGALAAHRIAPALLRSGFGWFVIAMAFFIVAQELPPLVGMAQSLPIALAAAIFGTGLVALALRFFSLNRGHRPDRVGPGGLGTDHVTRAAELGGETS